MAGCGWGENYGWSWVVAAELWLIMDGHGWWQQNYGWSWVIMLVGHGWSWLVSPFSNAPTKTWQKT